jgi:uncharacterized membrane protein YgcG
MVIKRTSTRLATAVIAAAMVFGAFALPAQAALRHIDGTVLSKNTADRTFRISTQNGNRIRIKVNSSTRFERIPGGFGGLHQGLRVEVDAKRTANGLVAVQVETRGGGGGGGDDGGADDNGSGGGGADDGPNHT